MNQAVGADIPFSNGSTTALTGFMNTVAVIGLLLHGTIQRVHCGNALPNDLALLANEKERGPITSLAPRYRLTLRVSY